jgi:hypothetical protein
MIERLTYSNVRHGSRSFEFSNTNVLDGANGIGKTTVADVVAYAFTGADSRGTQAPTHLITEGAEKLSIKIDTGKAVLERTLTRKGNSTIKLTQGEGLPATLTQQDLTAMTASKDAFLAAFVCGYFMDQTEEKKAKILSEASTPVDKQTILETLLGRSIPQDLQPLIKFDKRTDLIIAKLSTIRTDINHTLTKANTLLEVCMKVPPCQEQEVEAEDTYQKLLQFRNQWEVYRKEYSKWQKLCLDGEKYKIDHEQYVQERGRLEALVKSLQLPPIPELDLMHEEIDELQSKLRPIPSEPHSVMLPDGDTCPRCGQTVGLKHREKVMKDNELILKTYKENVAKIEEGNAEVLRQILSLETMRAARKEAHAEATKRQKEVGAQCFRAMSSLAALREPTPPNIGPAPEKPLFDEPTQEDLAKAERSYRQAIEHNARVRRMAVDYAKAQKEAQEHIQSVEKTKGLLQGLDEVIEALKKLDAAVFEASASQYCLRNGYRLLCEEGTITAIDSSNKPYSQMSTGERIRTNAYICERVANGLPRKVKFIFIDNADLVSGPLNLNVEQQFLTSVTDSPVLRVTWSPNSSDHISYEVETVKG